MARLHPAAAHWDDADLALGRPIPADAFRPEIAVLAAITSRYEDARARIIAAVSSPDEPQQPPSAETAPPGWAPTVPVDLGSGQPHPPEQRHLRAVPDEPPPSQTGRWRELLRRRPH